MNEDSDIIDMLGIEAHIRSEVLDAVPEAESHWHDTSEHSAFHPEDSEQLETWVRRTLATWGGDFSSTDDDR